MKLDKKAKQLLLECKNDITAYLPLSDYLEEKGDFINAAKYREKAGRSILMFNVINRLTNNVITTYKTESRASYFIRNNPHKYCIKMIEYVKTSEIEIEPKIIRLLKMIDDNLTIINTNIKILDIWNFLLKNRKDLINSFGYVYNDKLCLSLIINNFKLSKDQAMACVYFFKTDNFRNIKKS